MIEVIKNQYQESGEAFVEGLVSAPGVLIRDNMVYYFITLPFLCDMVAVVSSCTGLSSEKWRK